MFCFYFITVITIIVEFLILIFTLLHILRITVWRFAKEALLLLLFLLYFFLVDQWTQLYFPRQEIIYHNIFGLAIPSLQWMSCIDCVKGLLNS